VLAVVTVAAIAGTVLVTVEAGDDERVSATLRPAAPASHAPAPAQEVVSPVGDIRSLDQPAPRAAAELGHAGRRAAPVAAPPVVGRPPATESGGPQGEPDDAALTCAVDGWTNVSPGTTAAPSPHEFEINASFSACDGEPRAARASGTLRQLSGSCTPAADTPIEGTIDVEWADGSTSVLEVSAVLDTPHTVAVEGTVSAGRFAGHSLSAQLSIVERDSFNCTTDPIERARFMGQVAFRSEP
jgi:hypothetical protein